MTRLFLIRHAETLDEDSKKIFKGRIDIPLSETGRARMERAAAFLSSFPLDVIYTSSLSRAIESGRIIGRTRGLDTTPVAAFNEIDFGEWEGLSPAEIQERYPEEFSNWYHQPTVFVPPAGESFQHVQQRGMEALRRVIESHKGQSVAVVAHAGILRAMIFGLLDIELANIFRIVQGYGCINIANIRRNGFVAMDLLNFTYY
jgi:broad specificity phosphatase PhoE